MKKQDILSVVKQHPIQSDIVSPDFFEGALLGNGNLGVVVCTRPDGIAMHFGHNNIWDIRISEKHKEKIGTFEEIWDKICRAKGDVHQEEWYQTYVKEVTASYHDYKYPRPYPASSLYLFFDRKEYEILGHSLDISNGLLTIMVQQETGGKIKIEIFVSQKNDRVYCRTRDISGKEVPLFYRAYLVPHEPDEGLPKFENRKLGFYQLLPYNGYVGNERNDKDKAFSVLYWTNARKDDLGLDRNVLGMTMLTLQVTEGFCNEVRKKENVPEETYENDWNDSIDSWKNYWELSGIELEDSFLEQIWYHNIYFLRCALNENCRCPGLFGNWMYQNIGTKWHGDYHFNYNTQQIFWGLMGANRMEQHMPYLRLVEDLLPVSKAWANDFYNLKGACFPHSAYPVPMTVMPYPSPDWGWEIFETPWAVQSLWWHYTYTKDKELLAQRIYPAMKEAAVFLVDYMTRKGANPLGDNKYHLFPTIVPELYGLSEGLKRNLDGTVDLTLTKFVFEATLQAIEELEIKEKEQDLIESIQKILRAYPSYATAESKWGEVFLSVQNEDPNTVIYNCPANLMQVFPGEDIDARKGTEKEIETAVRSWRHHYNEGGNDLVFYHIIGARLGILDLEKFKRHIRYCLLPNGTATDLVTLTGGRYPDTMDMKYMARMGIWVENFSLYSVINECLLWGHGEIVEVFPNWDINKKASFCSLRVKGAFLIDSSCNSGRIEKIGIRSEKGGIIKIKNPWKRAKNQFNDLYEEECLIISMKSGEEILLTEDV